jgi:hypothetical protein
MRQKLVATIGAIITIGLFLLTNAKRAADTISIIHLPHDVGEILTSMSQTPNLISNAALAVGLICLAYLVVSHWRREATLQQPASPNRPPLLETTGGSLPNPAWSRDVSLAGALWRAFDGDWMNIRPPQGQLEERRFERTADQIRQHAFDGTLPVWGRRKGSNLFEQIPREFWINHAIESSFSRTTKAERNLWVYVTHPLVVGDVTGARTAAWEEFMTSTDAVENLWPPTS